MNLTMLGCYGGVPGSDDACSSFVIETESGNILIDCGSGVVSNLLKHTNLKDLKVVILSHLHFDHFNDLFTLYYAYKVGISRGELSKICVYMPCFPIELLRMIINRMQDVFDFEVYMDQDRIDMLGVSVDFCKTKHGVETYAMKFEQNGNLLGFSSDTGYFSDLVTFFKGCDVLIAESSLLKGLPKNEEHMTAEEALKLAVESNVKKLILTHFWYEISKHDYLEELLDCPCYSTTGVDISFAKHGLKVIVE